MRSVDDEQKSTCARRGVGGAGREEERRLKDTRLGQIHQTRYSEQVAWGAGEEDGGSEDAGPCLNRPLGYTGK